MTDWQPIATAHTEVKIGTVADLRMESGRVYRAAWTVRGNVGAWWPLAGNRKRPIGLYDPIQWKRVDNVEAMKRTRR